MWFGTNTGEEWNITVRKIFRLGVPKDAKSPAGDFNVSKDGGDQ